MRMSSEFIDWAGLSCMTVKGSILKTCQFSTVKPEEFSLCGLNESPLMAPAHHKKSSTFLKMNIKGILIHYHCFQFLLLVQVSGPNSCALKWVADHVLCLVPWLRFLNPWRASSNIFLPSSMDATCPLLVSCYPLSAWSPLVWSCTHLLCGENWSFSSALISDTGFLHKVLANYVSLHSLLCLSHLPKARLPNVHIPLFLI